MSKLRTLECKLVRNFACTKSIPSNQLIFHAKECQLGSST